MGRNTCAKFNDRPASQTDDVTLSLFLPSTSLCHYGYGSHTSPPENSAILRPESISVSLSALVLRGYKKAVLSTYKKAAVLSTYKKAVSVIDVLGGVIDHGGLS